MKSAIEVFANLACIHRSSFHHQFTRPEEPPFPLMVLSTRRGCCRAAFKGFELFPVSRAGCTFGRSSQYSHWTVSRVTQSVHCDLTLSTPPKYPNRTHPSFQAHVAADVIFGFIDVSSWRFPSMDVAFRMFRVTKLSGRHICRKHKTLAINLIAALGQPKKLISGSTWSPNPIHPCGLLETPISQV